MAKYDFKCVTESCGVVQEVVQSVHDELPNWKKCPACGGRSEFVMLQAPAVATANMENQALDVAIGRDADKRWQNIHDRKAKRDKVRKESGQQNLTMTGFNEFKPLPKDSQLTLVKGIKADGDK